MENSGIVNNIMKWVKKVKQNYSKTDLLNAETSPVLEVLLSMKDLNSW